MGKQKGVSPFVKQCFVVSGVAINIIGHGTIIGFTAVLFPQLEIPGSEIPINNTSKSWIASIPAVSQLIGIMVSSILMEKRGRRFAHIVSCIPINVGWFIIATSKGVPTLIFARFLHGLTVGLQAPLRSVLIGEYTSPKNRGPLLAWITIAMSIGVSFVQTVGSFLSWRYTALVSSAFCFIGFIIATYSPESPSWLASEGRYKECEEAFHWLRGKEDDREMEAMIEARKAEKQTSHDVKDENKFRTFVEILQKREFIKPVIVVSHLYVMLQFSGAMVFTSYMVEILHAIIGKEANAYFWMITLGVVRIIANFFSMYFIRTFKRRHVLLCSSSLCFLSLLCMATYCLMITRGWGSIPWISVIFVFVYSTSISAGLLPIPFTIAGEVFPAAHRGLASGVSVVFLAASNFAALKVAPTMFTDLGIHGTFFIYSGFVIYCFVVSWSLLPETKNKTLQQIEEEFRGNARKEDIEVTQPLSLENRSNRQ